MTGFWYTYDFNPFPYCPIWVDSGVRLADFPNWITLAASPGVAGERERGKCAFLSRTLKNQRSEPHLIQVGLPVY